MSLTVIPSIDLRAGRVVRLQQGDYDRQLNYDVDPLAVAAGYAAAGATWLHVVDLDGAKAGQTVQAAQVGQLATGVPGLRVQAGGGVRSTDDIQRLFQAGVERVVVGTAAMERWDWFEQLAHDPHYAGKLTLAIDARDGVVATHGWTAASTRTAVDVARQVRGWPLAALLYTDVAKDGMLTGPNVERTAELAAATDVPVIASGGVGSVEHIRSLAGHGIWAVIVGRSLYEGKVDLGEAIAAASAER
jgi:phosphoribosylformimino-5-aminoimidazole carboxamide ribotide isomerase